MNPYETLGVKAPERVSLCDLKEGEKYFVLCPSMGLMREMILESLFLTSGDMVFFAPKTEQFNSITFISSTSDKGVMIYR
jgi:hypothetical protein